MRGILKNRIDADAMFNIQNEQYSQTLYMAATIPALSSIQVKTSVSSEGHFFLNYMTGSFTTLSAGPVDGNVDYLRAQLRDGGKGNRPLFSDYTPLHLFLTPGRRKSALAAGSDSNNLFLPIDFEYLFQANSEIVMEVKNDSDYANSFSIAFFGIRIRSSAAVSGIK